MTLSTASHSLNTELSKTDQLWWNYVRVIVMARQQTPSSKDNDPGCRICRVRKVVVLFCFGKGPLDHERDEVCGRRRNFDDETSRPLSHYDLVNLTS